MYTYDVIDKTGSTCHIATLLEEDRATATGNMHRNLTKILRKVPRCTRRQTDRHITILRSAPDRRARNIVIYLLTCLRFQRLLNKDRKREDSSVTVDSGIGDRLRGGLYDI